MWQRRTVCRSWVAQNLPQIQRLCPRTIVEQPQNAHDAGLVGELHPELGEVHLRLFSRWGLETALEGLDPHRPGVAQKVGDDAVAARIAALLQLA